MNGTGYFDSLDRVYVIAEAGVNHNGEMTKAIKLIEMAKKAGADAVKFQTFKSEKVISRNAKMAIYQKKNIGKETSQIEMVKKLELSYDEFISLKNYCDKIGIVFLSTPFDNDSVDFLSEIVPFFKIGSGELTNLPFLAHVASNKKPILLSTGMSKLGEVEKALEIIECSGNDNIALLHCTTNYPCPYEEVNLRAMLTLGAAFKIPVGYSDHTLGIEIPIAAVAMGAKIIEKHFTLDRQLPGPDHKASLEPAEMALMVRSIRNVEAALGNGIKRPNASEFETMTVARKSLVALRSMKAGEVVTVDDIAIKRPGDGLEPSFMQIIVGKKLIKAISQDSLFTWEHFMGVEND